MLMLTPSVESRRARWDRINREVFGVDLIFPAEIFHRDAEREIRTWFRRNNPEQIRILILPGTEPWNPREESQPWGQVKLEKSATMDYWIIARPGERVAGEFGAVEVFDVERDWE